MANLKLSDCSLMGRETAVTNRIRQILTKFFEKDERTEANMVRLVSREEFGLSPAEKNAIKKSVKDDAYWQAAEAFVLNWVSRKAKAATFGVLLAALQDLEWTTLQEDIESYNWAAVEGMMNLQQQTLEQLL